MLKRKVLLIIMLIASNFVWGETRDSLEMANLQKEISELKVSISRLQQESEKNQSVYQKQQTSINCLQDRQKQQDESLNALANKIGKDLLETNKNLEARTSSLSIRINNRTWLAGCGILIALAMLGVVYFILRKKSSSIDKIKAAQDSLETAQKEMQEESVQLDNKLLELLDKQMNSSLKEVKDATPEKVDHSFALKVGDEIAKIETNLSKMDPEVRGYTQLKQALKRIKDNFNAHGYEIVELLGLDYNDGMPFEAQFVPDDTLPEGKRIISGISRLQINYNGEMIQSAKITVRQNI